VETDNRQRAARLDEALLERLCERCPELVLARRLVQAFTELVCERQGGAALRGWLDKVTRCELQPLLSFAAGLRKDLAAVVAGVTLPWSSGVVEGHNTRIKLIKRMMYGRGSIRSAEEEGFVGRLAPVRVHGKRDGATFDWPLTRIHSACMTTRSGGMEG